MALRLNDFWEIIDSTAHGVAVNRVQQVNRIEKILGNKSLEDLASFHRHLNRTLTKAYTFPLMVAAFTIHSHIADDLFLEFRAWLILHGAETFKRVLKKPDEVTSFLSRRQVDQINCGGFPELVTKLWLERGADLKLYSQMAGFLDCPKIATHWPKSKKDFEAKYPVLYKAFWNQSRINAFHH